VAGAWLAGAVAAFTVYLRLAETRAVNSDGASQALQAWDMLHGNPLLRGWTVSDVSFYTTELPQYAVVELIRGLRADVVDIAAAMTYTLVVLLAALVAKGNPRGRQALVRVSVAAGIMLAPQLGSGTNVLLSSPDHIGTSVPLLLTWLVLDRGGRRWYVPVITSALLAWTEVADSIAAIAGIIPLALAGLARSGRAALARSGRDARYELALAGRALAAAVAARRIRRSGDLVGQVLLAAIAVSLAAFLVTERVVDASSAREIAPVLPFAAALAARELSPVLTRTRPRSLAPGPGAATVRARLPHLAGCLLVVIGIGYLGGLGRELAAPAAPPQGAALTAWLESHRLPGAGLGGYWQASVVTLTSGGTVAIRPIADDGGGIGQYTIWYWPTQNLLSTVRR